MGYSEEMRRRRKVWAGTKAKLIVARGMREDAELVSMGVLREFRQKQGCG